MSFYLIPATSYQTQQKLKSQMQKKKSPHHRRLSSSSTSHSTPRSYQASMSSSSSAELSVVESRSGRKDVDRKKSTVFNYDCNKDVNEVIKFSRDQKRRSQRKSASLASSMVSSSYLECDGHSTVTVDTNQLQPPVVIYREDKGESIIEEIEDESLDESPLVRTYSNVSSIFSTRPEKKSPKSKSPKETLDDIEKKEKKGEKDAQESFASRLKKRFG